jgi:hypothetical protein
VRGISNAETQTAFLKPFSTPIHSLFVFNQLWRSSGAGACNVCGAGYMRVVRDGLHAIAQWPRAQRRPRASIAVQLTLAVVSLISHTVYIRKNIINVPFMIMGQSYVNMAMTILYLVSQDIMVFLFYYDVGLRSFSLLNS